MGETDPQLLRHCLAAAGSAALASWALARFLRSLSRDRLLADTPLVKIRSAAQGYVKVAGRAAPAGAAPLAAPLSGRPCVWWSYTLEHNEANDRGDKRWRTVETATSVDLFALEDGDARCLVGPVNAEITPTSRDVWCGARPYPGTIPSRPRPEAQLDFDDYRYTERLLSVGDRLSVLGELRSHSEAGDGTLDAAHLLRCWKQDQGSLLARFDSNHDGRIDSLEWETARRAAEAESGDRKLKSPLVRMSVISEPANGQAFLIAALDDKQLTRREKLHAAWYFGLGLLCVILCAWSIEGAGMLHAPT